MLSPVVDHQELPISNSTGGDPYCIFCLEDFGVNRDRLLKLFERETSELKWDSYDVRRFQREILLSHVPESTHEIALLNEFYSGRQPLAALNHLINKLQPEQRNLLELREPHRRRTVSRYRLTPSTSPSSWEVERLPLEPVVQNVPSNDIRSIPRFFKEAAPYISEDREFHRLLCGASSLARALARTRFNALEVWCWHCEVVAHPMRTASNAPEGIHQDGADFIVSALVLDRQNATGGTSRIFGPDKETELLSHTLTVGTGIFQADTGSELWHDVTPIAPLSPTTGPAIRRTLGLDIVLLK